MPESPAEGGGAKIAETRLQFIILISDKLVDKNPRKNPYVKAFDADFICF
jgi:hypothetical protein